MNVAYRLGWLAARAVFTIYFRRRVWNVERVPLSGPAILASNHASYLDPPLIGSAVRREINYLARSSLFVPAIGWLLRLWNAVPVDREGGRAGGLKGVLDRLGDGGAVILFPEGTRTPDGQLQKAHTGLGLTVLKSAAPVLPVRTFGTFEAYGRHLAVPRPFRVAVKFGRPLDFTQECLEARSCSKPRLKELYQEISNKTMDAIAHLEPWEDKSTFP